MPTPPADLSGTIPEDTPEPANMTLKYLGDYSYKIEGVNQTGVTVTLTPGGAPARSLTMSPTSGYVSFDDNNVTETGTWATLFPFNFVNGKLMGRGRLKDNIGYGVFGQLTPIPMCYPNQAKVYFAEGKIRFYKDGVGGDKIDVTVNARFDYERDPTDPAAARWLVRCGVTSVDAPGVPLSSGGGDEPPVEGE